MRRWLAEGRVPVDSHVWRDGMPDWQGAATVFPSLAAAPPQPVATATAVTPASPAGAVGELPGATSGAYRHRRRKSNSMALVMVVGLVLASLGLIVAFIVVMMNQ